MTELADIRRVLHAPRAGAKLFVTPDEVEVILKAQAAMRTEANAKRNK